MLFKSSLQHHGIFHQRGHFVQQRFISGNGGIQARGLFVQRGADSVFALGKRSDDFAFFGQLRGIIVGFGECDFAVRQETVSQRAIPAVQTQHVDGQHFCAVHGHKPVNGAHEGMRAAAPAHHFGNGQFLHGGVHDIAQQGGQFLAFLREFVGIHILFAVVDDVQAAFFHAAGTCKAFNGFFVGCYGRAFFHDVLVGLLRFDARHLHGQTARRSISGVFGGAVNQLRFFQAFGNGLRQVVAQLVQGFRREFFGKQFDE